MFSFLGDYVIQVVLVATIILGAVCGGFGVFTILNKQALVGDALSHAALPGVVLSFIFIREKNMPLLVLGAFLAALIAMGLMHIIKKYSVIKSDAALALLLSSFFGFGQVLMSWIRNDAGANQAGLDHFIFGQAAAILREELIFMVWVLIIVVFVVVILFKHFKLYIFDRTYYQSLGFNPNIIRVIFTVLTVVVVVVSIQTVGVILMSALLIAPGVAARQWSSKFMINILLASIFGAISGVIGTISSATVSGLPTGPVIVISVSTMVIVSMLVAPKRGLLAKYIKDKWYQNQIVKYRPLIHAYETDEILHLTYQIKQDYIQQGLLKFEKDEVILTNKGIHKIEKLMKGEI